MHKALKWAAGGILTGALVAIWGSGVFLAETSTHRQSLARVVPEQTIRAAAADVGATESEVSIAAGDGATLRGSLFLPNQRPRGAVILLHGLGDSRAGMLWKAELFLQRGFMALTPDLRAHGASGGKRITFGCLEAEDVRTWADWLKRYYRPRRLFAIGHSLGGAVVLQSLGLGDRFSAVIAEAPFADFAEIALERIAARFQLPDWWIGLPSAEAAFAWARFRFGINLDEASPVRAVAGTHVPVLLIHGSDDESISVHHSRELHRANPGKVQYWEVPKAHHNDIPSVAGPVYQRRIVEWFESFADAGPS